MKRIALIGSKEMATRLSDKVTCCGMYEVVGFFDDFAKKGGVVKGKPILGGTDECVSYYQNGCFDFIFIACGYNSFKGRQILYEKIKGKIPMANIISPRAYVHPSAKFGEGILVSDDTYISYDAIIEDNVAITLRSIVNHGCHIKKHTFFSTGVTTAGNVTVGERCFVGVGVTISDGVSICDDVWLSPGSIVVKNLKKPGHYMSQAAKLYNIG